MLGRPKQTLCTPGLREPMRLSQNCAWVSPVEVHVSSGLLQGQGLWVQQAWVWHKPSWRRSPLTPPQSRQNLQGLGKQTFGGNKALCTPGPRREEQWSYKRLTQTCLQVSRSLRQSHGLAVACCRVGGTQCSSACMGPFEGGHHYLHYLHHSWPQVKQQGGNTAVPRKLD